MLLLAGEMLDIYSIIHLFRAQACHLFLPTPVVVVVDKGKRRTLFRILQSLLLLSWKTTFVRSCLVDSFGLLAFCGAD